MWDEGIHLGRSTFGPLFSYETGCAQVTATRRPDRPPRVQPTRAKALHERLKELILESNLSAGDPMPTEFELMESLNVSRNSLREALKALQAVGIVEVRHGFGMYVGQMSLGGLVDELTFHGQLAMQGGHESLLHLVELREMLEWALVERSIDRFSEADLDELSQVLERMDDEARAGRVTSETDRLFHEVLYRALDNPLASQLLGAFWIVFQQLQQDLPQIEEKPRVNADNHRAIYDAIRTGDRARAVAAMERHFDAIRARTRLSAKDYEQHKRD